MESIFTDIQRTDLGPKPRSEGTFSYLNRSAGEHASRVRALLESWYSTFPDGGKHEIRQRLRSDGDSGFESAFHELLLSATANALGCVIVAHPQIQGTDKRPDFTIESKKHGSSFLEAVLATGQSDSATGTEKRERTLLDCLDGLECQEFFIEVEVIRQSERPGSCRKLRRFASEWLKGLDHAEVRRTLGQSGTTTTFPTFIYDDDGWRIKLTAIPKSRSRKSKTGRRAIGCEITGMHQIDSAAPLKSALKKKAGRYGDLGGPFIIDVNALDMLVDDIDFEEALFGTEYLQVEQTLEGGRVIEGRRRDGLWGNGSAPSYTRVSGVLFTWKARSSNFLVGAEAQLYLNPWTAHPYSGELTRLPTAAFQGDRYVKIPGISLEELLGVGNFWID